MKSISVVILFALMGCASAPKQAISYDQLRSIRVTNRDCPDIDRHVSFVEQQLKLRGLTNAMPEDLDNDDRQYNATARIIIWSLRIGCANPDRYAR